MHLEFSLAFENIKKLLSINVLPIFNPFINILIKACVSYCLLKIT